MTGVDDDYRDWYDRTSDDGHPVLAPRPARRLEADPAVLDAERRHLLERGWHYVGDATPVAAPRSFLTAQVGATPVVITRDDEGALHGLINVCRHRGAPVATGCGSASALACRYHGWSYHLVRFQNLVRSGLPQPLHAEG